MKGKDKTKSRELIKETFSLSTFKPDNKISLNLIQPHVLIVKHHLYFLLMMSLQRID